MKRTETQSIGDVMRAALEESCMSQRLDERRACELWGRIVGPGIAGMCGRADVVRGVLQVPLRSAPLRQELSMHRTEIAERINACLGRRVISDIRFIQG